MAAQGMVGSGSMAKCGAPMRVATTTPRSLRPVAMSAKRSRRDSVTTPVVTARGAESPVSDQPYDRVYNFSAGPACLPVEVLEQAQSEMLNWRGSGMSVMEMSHRGKEFESIIHDAEQDLRSLLNISDDYEVLFVPGGASTQFASVPLNLAGADDVVDYVVTGSWSKKAFAEGKRFAKANLAAQGDNKSIPDLSEWTLSPDAKFVHLCDNETIQGVEFQGPVDTGGVPLVADISSNICSKPVDVSKYGILYGGAQKNIGAAGVTVVIVRKDLVGNARDATPTMLDYKTMVDSSSLYNTPPCFAIYMCGLVFQYLKKQGGLEGMLEINSRKAKVLYDMVENSNGFYASPVEESVRSNMNVPITIPSSQDLEKLFISEAADQGLKTLKGHRSVGGMRASIYNSMPEAGVQKLAAFMAEFASKHS
ncbi:hypothetical protein BSKO_08112 [Bryopsis sp. KO-2023]|nr:hypothetical protein BSKO_08112 [Bryopsis sp. KO-2023]